MSDIPYENQPDEEIYDIFGQLPQEEPTGQLAQDATDYNTIFVKPGELPFGYLPEDAINFNATGGGLGRLSEVIGVDAARKFFDDVNAEEDALRKRAIRMHGEIKPPYFH